MNRTPDLDTVTAGDSLRPVLLHFLRSSMTPDSDPIVDEEEQALGEHVGRLSEPDFRRLLFLGASIVSLASPAQLGALNLALRELELPVRVVQPRGNG